MRTFNASELKLNLDRMADPRPVGGFIFEGADRAWSMLEHAKAFLEGTCYECGGKPRGRRRYCLACDRCGLDGIIASYPAFP